MVEFFFPTPIYVTEISGIDFMKVQNEFKGMYEDHLEKDRFMYDRGRITQLLTKNPFESNVLKEYNTTHFNRLLEEHIKKYIIESVQPEHQRELRNHWPFVHHVKSSWMTLNKKGMYALAHDHGFAEISGVYYYKTNSRDGNIMFYNPNRLITTDYVFRRMGDAFQYTPEEGHLILFPGWLLHSVHTNNTETDRVSISFNVYFDR